MSRSIVAWLTATAYRQTTQGKEKPAVCQPASVNYLLCLNSAEHSKAYRHTACYNMVELYKLICVCEDRAGLHVSEH